MQRPPVPPLDTNAVIAAVEGKQGLAVLQGQTPVVSMSAVKEFLRAGGSIEALRDFLVNSGGRVSVAGSEAMVGALQREAAGLGRVLGTGDARIVASAMRESVALVINDIRLARFLRAIGYPVRGY